MKRGLLLTLTEPPPAMDEEFNAWYDHEHLPERLAIPGFRSARRWVSGRTYLATYELDSLAVLSSAAYLARYQNQTPWSRRCLGKCLVFKRWACEQTAPGEAEPHPAALALLFAMDERPARGVLQTRTFAATSGERVTLHELGTFDDRTADAYRLYQP
jgi:hypothetical protein